MSRSFCVACDAAGGQSISPVLLSSTIGKLAYFSINMNTYMPLCIHYVKALAAYANSSLAEPIATRPSAISAAETAAFSVFRVAAWVNRDHRHLLNGWRSSRPARVAPPLPATMPPRPQKAPGPIGSRPRYLPYPWLAGTNIPLSQCAQNMAMYIAVASAAAAGRVNNPAAELS